MSLKSGGVMSRIVASKVYHVEVDVPEPMWNRGAENEIEWERLLIPSGELLLRRLYA